MSYSKFVKTMLTIAMVTIFISLAIAGVGCATAKDVSVDETTSAEETTTVQVTEASIEETETYVKGIDVSYRQGCINENAVPGDIQMVVIRMGRSTYGSWSLGMDNWFDTNIQKFSAKDTDIAVYWYSTAITEAEAITEAQYIAREFNKLDADVKNNIKYLFIDREESPELGDGRADNISDTQLTNVLVAQFDKLEECLPNVNIGLYANISWLCKVDVSRLGDVPCWVAWPKETDHSNFDQLLAKVESDYSIKHAEYLENNIVMWQYSFNGSVSGISGDVDLNLVSSKMLK